MKEKILSVGIDIGTSTTQLVFSELIVENTASSFSIPKIKIIDKQVIYKSKIYFTPLRSINEIDGEIIKEIIEGEYKNAEIDPGEVNTGAVIITGETARKKNASIVLNQLSGLAGDFVVATAGPDLEAIIAGKGGGVDRLSKDKDCIVANLDIGGGTTNIAIFKDGEVIDTTCLDIGGRLIKVSSKELKVQYVAPKIKELARRIGVEIETDMIIDKKAISDISKRMAELLEEVLDLRKRTEDLKLLFTTKDFKSSYKIDYISFSGGIADCIYGNELENDYLYEDIGVVLGKSIRNSRLITDFKVFKPIETIRATVVGAGSHTTDISGSTITFTKDLFPLKNIPILKLTKEDEALTYGGISQRIREKMNWFKLNNEHQQVALALKGVKNISFKELQEMAIAIAEGIKDMIRLENPIIIIVENDIAKALGQTLYRILDYKRDVICIDTVKVDNGDYIDIGKPLANGKVLPVIIKTLAFGY